MLMAASLAKYLASLWVYCTGGTTVRIYFKISYGMLDVRSGEKFFRVERKLLMQSVKMESLLEGRLVRKDFRIFSLFLHGGGG